jgi:tetratricopeptide (TPR) repeat protein
MIISFVLAIVLSRYTLKRFVEKTKEIELKDAHRLKEIMDESRLFKLLFKASLHKNNRKTNIFFMFLFNFSMPLVGYLFSMWIAWYLKNVSYEQKISHTNILNLDEFGMSFLKVERIFGEGSMSDLMLSDYAPKSKKLKALSALANNLSPSNLKIIRQTLSSTDDEIRMFGYAIINKAEKALNVKMSHYLDVFTKEYEENSQAIKANAAKELAHLYWEMVYTELSHESLKDNFVNDVVKYLKIARSYYIPELSNIETDIEKLESKIEKLKIKLEQKPQKELPYEETQEYFQKELLEEKRKFEQYTEVVTRLHVLMGRVYMYKKEYENAKTEFTLAQELHTHQLSFIIPYLAEIHFLTGNYKVVSAIMKSAKDLELNATLFPIMKQWKVA